MTSSCGISLCSLPQASFHSVVVITSALHAEGRRFEPGWKHWNFFLFVILLLYWNISFSFWVTAAVRCVGAHMQMIWPCFCDMILFLGHPPGRVTNSIFCFLFVKKIIDLPGGQIIDPWVGKNTFLFRASNSLVSVLDPWRAFWPDTTPFKGPRASFLKPHRYMDTIRFAALVVEVPRQITYNWHKPWLCGFWKRTLLHWSMIVKSQ